MPIIVFIEIPFFYNLKNFFKKKATLLEITPKKVFR